MGHMTISDQLLRPRSIGLFWVTCPFSGLRSYPAPLGDSGWEEPISDIKWVMVQVLTMASSQDLSLAPRL